VNKWHGEEKPGEYPSSRTRPSWGQPCQVARQAVVFTAAGQNARMAQRSNAVRLVVTPAPIVHRNVVVWQGGVQSQLVSQSKGEGWQWQVGRCRQGRKGKGRVVQ